MRYCIPFILSLVASKVAAVDFAGPDQFICGTATIMQADPLTGGQSGFWTVVQGSANFAAQSSPTSIVTDLTYGENILQWTIVEPGGAFPDLVSVWCYNSAMPVANAGPDQVVLAPPGFTYMNGSAPIAPAICVWTIVSGTGVIANANDPLTWVGQMGMGWNVFIWTCDNGPCGISSDDVVIQLTPASGLPPASADDPQRFYYDVIGQRLVFIGSRAPSGISLFDVQGRLFNGPIKIASSNSWSLADLPSGVYLVRAFVEDQVIVERLVVSH